MTVITAQTETPTTTITAPIPTSPPMMSPTPALTMPTPATPAPTTVEVAASTTTVAVTPAAAFENILHVPKTPSSSACPTTNPRLGSRKRRYATSLASYVWHLKDEGILYVITWKIQEKSGLYIKGTKRYKLYIQARILKKLPRALRKEINKKYKIVPEDTIYNINKATKLIMEKYEIDNKMEPYVPMHPRVTLKDHKDNFYSDPKVRLICPSKSDLGKLNNLNDECTFYYDKHSIQNHLKPEIGSNMNKKPHRTHWIWEVTSMVVNGKAERIPSIKEENMIDYMLKDQLDSKPSPRVLNTHLHPNVLPEVLLKNNKIIFIARNPKSVVVSYYRHMWSIDLIQYDGNFHSFFEMFMDGNVPRGDYFEYTRQWWSVIKDNPNVLIITYEEASKDLVKIVSLIAKFLGKKIDEQLTKDIADMCTFDRMKNEKPSIKENVLKVDFKDNSGFFRSGKVSTWKEWMTVAQNERMDARIQKELLEQGINLNILLPFCLRACEIVFFSPFRGEDTLGKINSTPERAHARSYASAAGSRNAATNALEVREVKTEREKLESCKELIQKEGSSLRLTATRGMVGGQFFEYTHELWRLIKDNPNAIAITYEEMKKFPFEVVSRIAKFLGKSISNQLAENIIDMCSFEKMITEKSTESSNFSKELFRDNGSFYHNGQIATWKKWLTVEQSERIDACIQSQLIDQGINFNF
eukprot:XP_014774057.1 PREDICTED: uncharacterized protein LOC106871849 [Octopus bimaculoides]